MKDTTKSSPPVENTASNDLEKADVAAGAAIAEKGHHPLLKAFGQFGELGDQGPLYLIGGVMVGIGAVRRDARCIGAGAGILCAVGLADLVKTAVKNRVTRSRPQHSVEENEYRFESGGSARKEEQSFPSGDAACTVAATEAAIKSYPQTATYLRPLALMMTLSRLAKADHWPLDLIVGAVIGKVSQTSADLLLRAGLKTIAKLTR